MTAAYTDSKGVTRTYRVTTWRVVRPTEVAWAIASQPVPSMTLQTCYGQTDDLTFPTDADRVGQYLRMVRRKTGSMIEAPLEAGAVLGGADAGVRRRFRLFGCTLGVAFQIVDDAIDYLGSEEKALKTLGADLRRRSGSAMLIHCRARCTPAESRAFSYASAIS